MGILYETSCLECLDSGGTSRANNVGESSRSGSERFNEHISDAENGRKDSHMSKHWTNHHGGTRTRTPGGRLVRIERTGAGRNLNSKTVYSRRKLPRIIADNSTDVETLGYTEEVDIDDDVFTNEHEVILTGRNLAKANSRRGRREKLCVLVRSEMG